MIVELQSWRHSARALAPRKSGKVAIKAAELRILRMCGGCLEMGTSELRGCEELDNVDG